MFVENRHCRHIVFGGCHDNGYVPFLDPYSKRALHITLLETAAPGREFKSLQFKTSRFPLVFSSRVVPAKHPTAAIPLNNKSYASTISNGEEISTATIQAAGLLWNDGKRTISLNSKGQRLDPKLAKYQHKAAVYLKQREMQETLCYDYHLTKKCKGPCTFSHEPIAPEQILVLRHWKRKMPCDQKAQCRSFDCYYGHVCPYPSKDCHKGSKCPFDALHDIDPIVAKKVTEAEGG